MKIIITESQYKLITEREDEKNIQQMREIYDSFMDKINARDYILDDSIYPDKWVIVRINTKYDDLFICLSNRESTTRAGEYKFSDSDYPKIIIYNCKIRISANNRLLNLKFNKQTVQHEIVHFIDERKNRIKVLSVSKEKYYNNEHEINAEFISIMNHIGGELPETFNDFVKSYREYSPLTKKQFAHLNEKNKKSLVGRLYQYYDYLKKK